MTSEGSRVRGVLQYQYQLPLIFLLVLLELQGEAPRRGLAAKGGGQSQGHMPKGPTCKKSATLRLLCADTQTSTERREGVPRGAPILSAQAPAK